MLSFRKKGKVMKQWKRLIYYLLLNVLVSACTTLTVLIIWDQVYSPSSGNFLSLSPVRSVPQAAPPDDVSGEIPVPQPTPTPVFIAYQVRDGETFDSIAAAFGVSAEELMAENGFSNKTLGAGEVLRIPVHQESKVSINSAFGVGDLNTERVLLKHQGEGEVLLTGWQIADEDGNTFTFPQLALSNGAVNVWTGSGTNTVVDLYWGLDQPVWRSGETVFLRDAQGEERATYTVP